MSSNYKLWHRTTNKQFRTLVSDTYPGLNLSPVYWKIMEHCLFGGRRHDHDEENCHLLLTREMMAQMVGKHTNSICVEDWVATFEEHTGISLNITDYSYTENLARAIYPEIDAAVLLARDRECLAEFRGQVVERVDFVSGEAISTRKQRSRIAERVAAVRDGVAAVASEHPARDLIRWLNEQHPASLSHRIKQNCEALITAAEALEPGVRKDGVYRILHAVGECCVMIYRPTSRSTRIFTEELTINCLPREFRLLATSGDVHLDLKCSQLAIATRLLCLPGLRKLLESGKSFWTEILGEMGLPESYKRVVKAAIYSALYGMSKANIREFLVSEAGERAADLFLRNTYVTDILKERTRIYKQIKQDGGIYDAFGTWLPIEQGRQAHKLFCAVAQSYELRLMLSALPVLLSKSAEVHCHSWLHDSLTLGFKHPDREDNIINQLVSSINTEASRLKLPTEVEITR